MRAHLQNSDTANTFSTGILNKNESYEAIRKDLNKTSSFNTQNTLTQVFPFSSEFRVVHARAWYDPLGKVVLILHLSKHSDYDALIKCTNTVTFKARFDCVLYRKELLNIVFVLNIPFHPLPRASKV
jgi:hypothetical protein